MMRVLAQPEPELVRLCRAKQWAMAGKRVQHFPTEASPTEACLRGSASTVLSICVTSGGPLKLLQEIHSAHPHQVGIVHKSRGSILHDALRYRVSNEVLEFVFQITEDYQKKKNSTHRNSYQGAEESFRIVHIQEQRILNCDLYESKDEFGRTILHCLINSIQYSLMEIRRRQLVAIFHHLLKVRPHLMNMVDKDGNTPLSSLLSLQAPSLPHLADKLEAEILDMVAAIVSCIPASSFQISTPSRPWKIFNPPLSSSEHSEVAMNSPLYTAILNNRSERIVQVLLEGHQSANTNGCATIVTAHCEYCLHVAVTMRASPPILQMISKEYPKAVMAGDIFGLNPIDWLWITYTKGFHGQGSRSSRRRYLGQEYVDWHDFLSESPDLPSQYDILDQRTLDELRHDMLDRMRVILPIAGVLHEEQSARTRHDGSMSLLYAVCCVPSCCLGMVKLVLAFQQSSQTEISQRDSFSGRLPLHAACSRIIGYTAQLPIGQARRVHRHQEEDSPAFIILEQYPEGARARDFENQLPLHVVIDAAKNQRSMHKDKEHYIDRVQDAENKLLSDLFRVYPASISQRDGPSMLFPWQQAATGEGASLSTTYDLLRRDPSVLK